MLIATRSVTQVIQKALIHSGNHAPDGSSTGNQTVELFLCDVDSASDPFRGPANKHVTCSVGVHGTKAEQWVPLCSVSPKALIQL